MNKNKKRLISLTAMVLITMLFFTGCASVSDWFSTTKGTLIGNQYKIYQYDNQGDLTLEIDGKHIDIEPYKPDIDEETGELEVNSVLDITIDGHQMITVGNTLIFEESGISKVANAEEIENISSSSGLRIMSIDKMINSFKNEIGKSRVVIVYSQLGDPIGVYEGNSVFVTIPKDLPKMTRLNVDGKSLYLHRLNYTIVDTALIK